MNGSSSFEECTFGYANVSEEMDGYEGIYRYSGIVHPFWQRTPAMHKSIHMITAVLGTVIWLLGVFGNLTVIYLMKRFRRLHTGSNLFVLNLTIADFLMSMGNIPMFVISSFYGHWVFGIVGCKAYAFVGSTGSFVSINTLTAIAIDRCFVIVNTFPIKKKMSGGTICFTVSFIWLYSIAWSCAPFFGFGNYILEGMNTSCTFDFLTRSFTNRIHIVSITVVHFVVPLIAITISYVLIFKAISKHAYEFKMATRVYGEPDRRPLRCGNQSVAYESMTARVAFKVILVFCFSWTPYAIIALIGVFGDVSMVTEVSAGIACIFAKFSTAINPMIYALLHPKFRKQIRELIFSTNTEQERTGSSFLQSFNHLRLRRRSAESVL